MSLHNSTVTVSAILVVIVDGRRGDGGGINLGIAFSVKIGP